MLPMPAPDPQPLWYKDAVIYLSSSGQAVELDLQSLAGALPIEMFGRSLFPRIGELPYMLTLGPYSFFWFKLRRF